MYELSANVEWLFTEAGPHVDDRIRAAGAHGLPAVEIWTWRDKPLEAVSRALSEAAVQLQTVCVEPMGSLVDPDGHAAFLGGLVASLPVAEELGSPYLVVTAGELRPGVDRGAQHAAVVAALRRAAQVLAGSDVILLLENLNSLVDHVGTFLDSTIETVDIVRAVGSPSVRVLYDLYHSLMMDEDPLVVLDGASDVVGHVQIGDPHGRIEPRGGPLDWPALLHALRLSGYSGRLGLEFMPTQPTADALAFIEKVSASA